MKQILKFLICSVIFAMSACSCSIERHTTRHYDERESGVYYAHDLEIDQARRLRKQRLNVATISTLNQSRIIERYRPDGTLEERETIKAEEHTESAQSEETETDSTMYHFAEKSEHAQKERAISEDSETETESKPPNFRLFIIMGVIFSIIGFFLFQKSRLKRLLSRG